MTRVKIYSFILLLWLTIFSFQTIWAANPTKEKIVLLKESLNPVDFSNSYVWEDSTNQLTIGQIVTPYWQNRILQIEKNISENKQKTSTYWRKIVLQNKAGFKTWLLELKDPHIENVEIFLVKNGVITPFPATGFSKSFDTRSLEHKNFFVEIPLEFASRVHVYIRIKSEHVCYINPTIRSISNFADYFLPEYFFLGVYYGIIFILVAYNFFLGVYTRERIYFFYSFYTICSALYTFAEDGLAFQWIWRDLPLMNEWLGKWAPALLLFSFILYSSRFLDIDTNMPTIRKYTFGSAILYLVLHIFFKDSFQFNYLVFMAPFLIVGLAALEEYRAGVRSARFFLLGNSIVLLSLFVYYCRGNGWLVSNAFTVYIFNCGFVFEALVLSISLADKVKITKDQKEAAHKEMIHQLQINDSLREKVNKELEEKVQQRTKALLGKTNELEEANKKLEQMKLELYEMNSKMDVNIWELKNEVKKELEARIFNDTISFEEFASVYTDTYCYRHLRDLKWKAGFVCPKCGNKKFGRGNNNFTYKCTQCQHQESVTSNTLFHAVKFPISKAFYLAYYLFKNGQDISYEELGAKLGLSKNTVWKFGKKVLQIVETMGKKSKAVDAWDKLILTNGEK
jgi:hypothetical protein